MPFDVDAACAADTGPLTDVVIQTSSQSVAYRIAKFFEVSPNDTVLPAHVRGSAVVEYGPRTNRDGPCSVLVAGVGSAASVFMEWFMAAAWLRRIVTRVYIFDAKCNMSDFSSFSTDDLTEKIISKGAPKCTLRLQCHPRNLEAAFCESLEAAGFKLDPREGHFEALLNIVCVDGEYRFGYLPARYMFRLSSTLEKRFKGLSSSAVNKLDEALTMCGQTTTQFQACVDIGAAPGAWTEYLAQRALRVVAVDPAHLSDACQSLPNVVHIQQQSQKCLSQIRRALEAPASSGRPSADGGRAMARARSDGSEGLALDVIACDMNVPPHEAFLAIQPLLPLLEPGGWVVMTCKLFGMSRNRTFEHVINDFSSLSEGRVLWLLANTQYERVYIGRKPTAPLKAVAAAATKLGTDSNEETAASAPEAPGPLG